MNRTLRALFALGLLALLASCGGPTNPPDEPADVTLRVRAETPLVAAEFVASYDPSELRFVGLAGEASGLLVRSFDDRAGRVSVALLGDDAIDGALVELGFAAVGSGGGDVVFEGGDAYASAGVPLAGALSASVTAAPDLGAAWDAGVDTLDATLEPLNHDPDAADLEASFAAYVLGNLDKSGTVDVLDALTALDIASRRLQPDAFERYHSDLDGDDDTDVDDVIALLEKVVDPTRPAAPVVKPSAISFAELQDGVPLLIGNAGSEPLTDLDLDASAGLTLQQLQGVSGQSAAYTVEGGFGTVTVSAAGTQTVVDVGNLVVLIVGQSNAVGMGTPLAPAEAPADGVRMLGNDYRWQRAEEPLDDPSGQVDAVSLDPNPGHSFGVRLGKGLLDATGRDVYLIPSALGGTQAQQWKMASAFDRGTLFGSANFRAAVSAGEKGNPVAGNAHPAEGGPVNAIVWYQGEANRKFDSRREIFIADTDTVMDAFDREIGAPIVYAQLASSGDDDGTDISEDISNHLGLIDVSERQRRMETGAFQGTSAVDNGGGQSVLSGDVSRQDFHMVVTHDLPMSDHIHLSAEGQRILGDRIALAVREHVLGESVDGTGPRIASVSRSGNQIRIRTTRPLNQDAGDDYEGYFTVFNGAPSSGDVNNANTYGTNTLTITDVARDPADANTVLITLASTPSVDPYVRYAPPYRAFSDGSPAAGFADVVKDPQTGLPLPTFGPLRIPGG